MASVDRWVHVGTYQSALDRIRTHEEMGAWDDDLYGPADTPNVTWRIYEVVIDGDPKDFADESDDHTVNNYAANYPHPDPTFDPVAYPYQNETEDIGALSYMVQSSAVRVIAEHTRPVYGTSRFATT